MKSAAHGTFLKALPSDNSYVEQTRDENELGTDWRIERIGVDVTRSYFGDFRFGDFRTGSQLYKTGSSLKMTGSW